MLMTLMYHTGCFHSSAGCHIFLFYDCKNVIPALGLGLIRCYQPLVVRKIIGREEKGQRRKGRWEDTVSRPSIILLIPLILHKPLLPKTVTCSLAPLSPVTYQSQTLFQVCSILLLPSIFLSVWLVH